MSHYSGCPWRKPDYNYGDGVIGLHEEIDHFYKYILPTPCEHVVRNELVKRIENLVHDLWPQSVVEIFGSFRTGLILPSSDIDIVVLGLWEKLPLRTLESELIARGFANSSTMFVVDMAQVPIVKFTDCETKIKVDISFNMQNGVQSAELIKFLKSEYPELGKLVMILKQFLQQRGLNEVFTGGISSYSLIIMCVSFMKLHSRNFNGKTNIGVLILEFFELYGLQFNYSQIEISIANGCAHTKRGNWLSPLCIPDPLQPGNDLGRGSFSIVAIKQAFRYAYRVLSQAVNPVSDTFSNNNSILGRIIHISDEVIEYRAWLHQTFNHLVIVENVLEIQKTHNDI
ncbi:non-canonical poly(A) RNA polymerase protein Trf4-1-like [Drosophila innubila]|uniref:non-canonical poly(A) RNA polymerase protein Trf4-1-like n=1 Tax=Drosophila innubila TaxID=198719 RepID=UPI00148D6578|nr:non-canonical poly(A) RNA polymerase protein Trf4-1-like [Drosophila innubila]